MPPSADTINVRHDRERFFPVKGTQQHTHMSLCEYMPTPQANKYPVPLQVDTVEPLLPGLPSCGLFHIDLTEIVGSTVSVANYNVV